MHTRAPETIHVVPLNDLKEHIDSVACRCRPSVEMVKRSRVVIHNSFDGREFFEEEAEVQKRGH